MYPHVQLESFEFDTAMSSKDIRLEGNDNDCLLKATDAMSLLTAQRLQATQHSEHDFDEDADLSWSSSGIYLTGCVAQSAKASDTRAVGRGFDSRPDH